MVPHFIAISLLMLLLTPGSMLSAFDCPVPAQRIAQLPEARAFSAEARQCIGFEQVARSTPC